MEPSVVNSLLQSIQVANPQLYAALAAMAQDLYDLKNQVNPPIATPTFDDGSPLLTVPAVQNFAIATTSNNIRLTWDAINGGINFYEIRLGADWSLGQILLTTTTLSANFDPIVLNIRINTVYVFQIAAKDAFGNYSEPVALTLNVPDITAPTLNPTVLNEFVLLSWTPATSTFQIAGYNIYRDGVFYGIVTGTFQAFFELTGGTHNYAIEAVDIVGNIGLLSSTVTVLITAPVDYVSLAIETSTFSGTKSNCRLDLDDEKLIAPVNTTEVYADHFINNSWTTPAAQVAAGFPFFIEPSKSTGATYTETFDFGAEFDAIVVSLDWNFNVIVGSVSINATMSVSIDNISFDTPVSGTTRFADAVRYCKVVLTFTPSPTTKSLVQMFNLRCALNVHREQDGGTIFAQAADAGGTVVTLNKAFRALDGITLAPISTTPLTAVFDFAFPANPTTFKILLFNTIGVRVDGYVSWDARGVI